jgi:hypothetical protein
MRFLLIRLLAAFALVTGAMLPIAPSAHAATAPDLTCDPSQPGPCTDTAHFSDVNELNAPASPSQGCPDWVSTDFATFVGTGNGIEHITVNKAQDAWFTTTFTGTITVTAYLHGTIDSDGNVTNVSDPDPNVSPFTGRVTEWFGIEFNRQTSVVHSTFHFAGSNAQGESLRVRDISHSSWAKGADPNGPPTKSFDKFVCL